MISFLFIFSPAVGFATASAPPVKWMVAHNVENEPFLELVRQYAGRIEEKTKGHVRIQIEPAGKFGDDTHYEAYKLVESGQAQFSQISIRGLGRTQPEILALDLPLLFSSYSQAVRFLDSPVAQKLKNEFLVSSKGKVRGLDFTFSGGYRKFLLKEPIQTLAALSEMKVRITDPTPPGPASQVQDSTKYFFDLLGLKSCSPSTHPDNCHTRRHSIERELNRIYVLRHTRAKVKERGMNVVLDSNHTLFLTMMVVNEKYLNSLSSENRQVVVSELHQLAIDERKLSVQLEQINREKLRKEGVQFVSLVPEDQKKMSEAARQTMDHFYPQFKAVIDAVRGIQIQPGEMVFGSLKDHSLN